MSQLFHTTAPCDITEELIGCDDTSTAWTLSRIRRTASRDQVKPMLTQQHTHTHTKSCLAVTLWYFHLFGDEESEKPNHDPQDDAAVSFCLTSDCCYLELQWLFQSDSSLGSLADAEYDLLWPQHLCPIVCIVRAPPLLQSSSFGNQLASHNHRSHVLAWTEAGTLWVMLSNCI